MDERHGSEPGTEGNGTGASFRVFWIVLLAGAVSLLGGGVLFILNQSGPGGASGQLGPGRGSEVYSAKQSVDIWQHERWMPGVVLAVDGLRYQVRYEQPGYPPEWVDASRLQAR